MATLTEIWKSGPAAASSRGPTGAAGELLGSDDEQSELLAEMAEDELGEDGGLGDEAMSFLAGRLNPTEIKRRNRAKSMKIFQNEEAQFLSFLESEEGSLCNGSDLALG